MLKIFFLLCICGLHQITQSVLEERIQLEAVMQDISVKEQYEFQLPEVDVCCICSMNHETNCNNEDSEGEIRVISNVSDRAQCSVKLRPMSIEKYFTAYKLDHASQQVYFRISYAHGNVRKKIDIPRGIPRLKTSDDSILQVDTSFNTNIVNALRWFYAERNSNNIRCTAEINDVNENDMSKLGWYRLNKTSGKYSVDEYAVSKSLEIDDRSCPTEVAKWSFRADHYYTNHGLLQSNLPGNTISEVTGGVVDNVKINRPNKIITLEYSKIPHLVKILPTRSSEFFNFSASLTLDQFMNKLIHITIYEVKASLVNVEIGIPGTLRSLLSFYHEKACQIHHHRIAASIIGSQWVCAYPTIESQRYTCVYAEYRDESVPNQRNYFNTTRYNFDRHLYKPFTAQNKIPEKFKQSNGLDSFNINIVYIIGGGILVLGIVIAVVIGIKYFLLGRRNERLGSTFGQYQQQSLI